MKTLSCLAGLALAAVLSARQPAAPTGASSGDSSVKLSPEELAAEREKYVQEVLAAIKGRETEPAEAVFKNIQRFKGVPAGRLPMIMSMGFSRSLGVSCTHCHTAGEWDRNDKRPKEAAREMVTMSRKINYELLPQVKNLAGKKPGINCTTCHRGEIVPSHDLPVQP